MFSRAGHLFVFYFTVLTVSEITAVIAMALMAINVQSKGRWSSRLSAIVEIETRLW